MVVVCYKKGGAIIAKRQKNKSATQFKPCSKKQAMMLSSDADILLIGG